MSDEIDYFGFFYEHGDAFIKTREYHHSNGRVEHFGFTVEQLYRAIKARLKDENLQNLQD